MIKTKGCAAQSAASPLTSFNFERHEPTAGEVQIEVLFCGVCHSDIHCVRNEWKGTFYPIVPGHEVIGRVVAVGADVTSFKEGDIVGVGPLIGSCGSCESCKQHLEQYCEKEFTEIFNSIDKYGHVTKGGYSTTVIIEEPYIFHIPKALLSDNLAALAPLFCAGLTTYSPLKHWNINKKSKVGIVGIGGLGHLAVKTAKAMGAQVVAFTSTPWKQKDAKRLGADEVVLTCDHATFKKHENSFDFILDVLPIAHDLNPYISLLKVDGTICLIGIPSITHPPFDIESLVFGRRQIAASVLGSPSEMREFLDFCAKHNIVADVEIIQPTAINESYERVLNRDVKYRFVMDMSALK